MSREAGEAEEQPSRAQKLGPSIVILRPLAEADLNDYLVWASDDRVTRFSAYETCKTRESLLEDFDVFLHHPYCRAICLDGGRTVGSIYLTPPRGATGTHRTELGYVLAHEYWGKGIMPTAVRKVLETAFAECYGLERIEALVQVENTRSQRVLEKVGFQKEGVLRRYFDMKGKRRDMVMYSFLSTDKMLTP